MKNIDLTSQFILYLSITLIAVIGAMNYWFYHDHTSHLTEALENRATAKMDFLESSTSYYLHHFEHELILELGKEAMLTDKDVVFLSIEDADGKKLFKKGNLRHKDNQTFSRQIIKDGDKKGELTLSLDIRQLKEDQRDTMLYTIGLMILSISLIGGMIYLFYRKKILHEFNVRKAAEKKLSVLNDSLEIQVDERTHELNLALKSAERASRAKSKFLTSMSHELRTPLHAVMAYSQLLCKQADINTKNKANKIYMAGERLLNLVNAVLDLTAIETGNIDITLESVDLHDLCEECRTLLTPMADKMGIHLELSTCSCSGNILADRNRLIQAVLNLVSNAIKYNRKDGSVHLNCSEDSEGQIYITVRDTGFGIESSRLKELFKPFNRLGKEGGVIEGVGIGLVITKELMEMMGFTLSIDSVEDEGCTFSIIIPSNCETVQP